ncbi:hypothetical protein ATO11_21055, partial [Pseudaestuariivita atlantica]
RSRSLSSQPVPSRSCRSSVSPRRSIPARRPLRPSPTARRRRASRVPRLSVGSSTPPRSECR